MRCCSLQCPQIRYAYMRVVSGQRIFLFSIMSCHRSLFVSTRVRLFAILLIFKSKRSCICTRCAYTYVCVCRHVNVDVNVYVHVDVKYTHVCTCACLYTVSACTLGQAAIMLQTWAYLRHSGACASPVHMASHVVVGGSRRCASWRAMSAELPSALY